MFTELELFLSTPFRPFYLSFIILMFSYLTRQFYQIIRTTRFSRSETASTTNDNYKSNSNCDQILSTKSSINLSNQQSIEKTIKLSSISTKSIGSTQSIESTKSIGSAELTGSKVANLRETLIITGLEKMPRKENTKFDELCKSFEIRLRNSMKMVNDKVSVESKEINKTIVIDDDIEEEIVNLIKKKNDKENKKIKRVEKEVKLFRNVTNKFQNNIQNYLQTNQQKSVQKTVSTSIVVDKKARIQDAQKSPLLKKAFKSVENLQTKVETKIEVQTEIVDIQKIDKKKYSNLKPENFRIQQVIKPEDLM